MLSKNIILSPICRRNTETFHVMWFVEYNMINL